MSKGVNKVILLGRLGREPELKRFANDNSLVQVSLATAHSWKDKNSVLVRERTEWHRLVFTEHLAELAEKYLHKGMQIYVEGRLATRIWTNQLDQRQYTTDINVINLCILSKTPQNKVVIYT